MGTRIEAAATAHRRGRLIGRGALHLSDAAATRCLRRARHRSSELDLLINAGLYKDFNAAEPALASIIQDDLGANRGDPPRIGHHGTFSFDVVNGGCGVVTAAQLIDAFVGHGSAQLGLIVAADADPSPRTSRGFGFSAVGGALLIAHGDGDAGFQRFALRTYPEHASMFESHLRFRPRTGFVRRGRNVVEIDEAPGFASCCVDRASELARAFLADASVRPDDIDLVIASQYPRGFGLQVARQLGLPATRVPRVASDLQTAHTAGPIVALEAAIASGQFADARHTLFVTDGAGLTIGLALYRA
ncbi:MAG TPA: 3-oxoacyl-[acyl-carrier-protein] synthase III C-terminal domain-containing protein [Kofleriaceae bacterium]|nr:3-oxoacyl-[acyl-carrier-protein] synthase III C-terminal domain-containing protein [Kofleriaceae bacterium]